MEYENENTLTNNNLNNNTLNNKESNLDAIYIKSNINISETQSKFKKFVSIFSFFYNKPIKNEDLETNPFIAQASIFLHSANYESYIKMLIEGYLPTKNQSEHFDKIIHNLFFNLVNPDDGYSFNLEKDISFLENLLTLGYELKQKDVLEFFKKCNDTILNRNEDFFTKDSDLSIYTMSEKISFPTLSNQIRNIIKKEEFTDKLYGLFTSTLEDKKVDFAHNFSHFTFILKNAPDLILRKTPVSAFLAVHNKFKIKSSSKHQQEIMNNVINHYYSNEMKPFYMNIKEKYTSDFVENIILNKVKCEIETLKEIPKQALDIIYSIEVTYKNIQKKSSNSGDIEHLNIMLDKRIPEILSKYLTIDPDYRTNLKNVEGKNAQELMIESLDNIASLFNSMYKDINQEAIHALSATNRYTRGLKN